MIGYLKGTVKYKAQGWVILDVRDVGYKVSTNAVADVGGPLELYIHHVVREDVSDLYGFSDPGDLAFFEQLISVSGVGPKAAMAIISAGGTQKVRQAIIRGDTTLLTSVSGVGKKMAAKIIVELKGKLAGGKTEEYLPIQGGENEDVFEALQQLGYKDAEIAPLLREMPEDLQGTQAKLTWALKMMKK